MKVPFDRQCPFVDQTEVNVWEKLQKTMEFNTVLLITVHTIPKMPKTILAYPGKEGLSKAILTVFPLFTVGTATTWNGLYFAVPLSMYHDYTQERR